MSVIKRHARRCFVDTNLWLYTLIAGQNPDKSAKARQVIQSINPVISTQVINEVCVNLIKKAQFSEDKIRQLIESFYGRCFVEEQTAGILIKASQLREQYLLSYWGSTIVASALEADMLILYSEDMQNGLIVRETLRIVNPFSEA